LASTRSEEEVRDLGRWWLVGDRLLAKIMGGSERATEDAGGDSGQADDGDAGAGSGDAGKGSDDTGKGEGGEESPEDRAKRERESERKPGEDRGAYRARMRLREETQRREQLEAELEALQDKDRTDQEKLEKRAGKAEQRVGTLEPTVRRQAIEIAFLKASFGDARRKPIAWVDAEDVLLLVSRELDGVKVGDDGDIDLDEVRAVVDDLAKRKPHLVRKQQQTQPSGGNVGAQGGRQGEPSNDDLARMFPAMRTRLPSS
jgi:hypothetical protein